MTAEKIYFVSSGSVALFNCVQRDAPVLLGYVDRQRGSAPLHLSFQSNWLGGMSMLIYVEPPAPDSLCSTEECGAKTASQHQLFIQQAIPLHELSF